jgi:hypothetical protein
MLSGSPVSRRIAADQLLERFSAGSARARRSLIASLEERRTELLPLIEERLDGFDATGDDWAAGFLLQLLVVEGDRGDALRRRYPEGWLVAPAPPVLTTHPCRTVCFTRTSRPQTG